MIHTITITKNTIYNSYTGKTFHRNPVLENLQSNTPYQVNKASLDNDYPKHFDDIIIRDKNGRIIRTIKTDILDGELFVNRSIGDGMPNLGDDHSLANDIKYLDMLGIFESSDAFGLGLSGSLTGFATPDNPVPRGEKLGTELIYFINGSDQFEVHQYQSQAKSYGVDISAGMQFNFYQKHDDVPNKDFNFESFGGRTYSLNAGIGNFEGEAFYAKQYSGFGVGMSKGILPASGTFNIHKTEYIDEVSMSNFIGGEIMHRESKTVIFQLKKEF
ncbi:MAG: hypothetical protein L3J20_05560 [Flavobacteriaceae bacterium]|nr:hypothetical protein [Flavobacteriaceae bacterium]